MEIAKPAYTPEFGELATVHLDAGDTGGEKRGKLKNRKVDGVVTTKPDKLRAIPQESKAEARLRCLESVKASIRAKVQHSFHAVKNLFGHRKVRYRGLKKNTAQLHDALAKAPALVIGEGYATADSLSQTLGFATVAAFDSGNLVPVAKALHEKYPDKPIVIAGDDKHLEATQGVNPGRSKAEEAARAVGGKLLPPIFAPGEQVANPKGFTDFNDLATRSVLGQEGIVRQVRSVVDDVLDRQQGRGVEELQPGQRQEKRQRRVEKVR